MSDRNDAEEAREQGGYGHPGADWKDDDADRARRGEPDSRGRDRDEEQEDEAEPPEPPVAEGAAAPAARRETPRKGEDLDVTWEQPQGAYPAQERPPDQADGPAPTAHIHSEDEMTTDEHDDVPEEAEPMPDATTGEEGGGTDAEFRDERDREGSQPPRKSPERERKRAG